MFDNIMSEINNLSKNDIDLMLSKRATLSDFCIDFYNKSAGEFGSKELYQMMGNKEKVKALGNALAFRVGEVCGLGDVEVKSLMRKIEEDKPLSLTDDKKISVKTGWKNKGFTLIELMVAVAVVGLLSAFAIPAYQSHVAKAQVSEGITLAEGFKSGVSEFYANNGIFPKLSDLGMVGAVGKWVSDTTINDNGVIVATFNSGVVKGLEGKTLSLTPSVQSSGNLSWACSSNAPKEYLPKSCLDEVASGGGSQTPPFNPATAKYKIFSFDKTNPNKLLINGISMVLKLDNDKASQYASNPLSILADVFLDKTTGIIMYHNQYYYPDQTVRDNKGNIIG